MKYLKMTVLALGLSATVAFAGETTLEGKIQCQKCTLKKAEKCGPALVYKGKDGKEAIVFLTGKASKSVKHGRICKPNSSVDVKVTGKLDGDKLTVAKLTESKKK
ncbi:MAG: hypothetical protein OSB29_10730 [Verrucomicrobiota bacterium]|nr:hypothetical protein [Verrucomicrobiota bacterium]